MSFGLKLSPVITMPAAANALNAIICSVSLKVATSHKTTSYFIDNENHYHLY